MARPSKFGQAAEQPNQSQQNLVCEENDHPVRETRPLEALRSQDKAQVFGNPLRHIPEPDNQNSSKFVPICSFSNVTKTTDYRKSLESVNRFVSIDFGRFSGTQPTVPLPPRRLVCPLATQNCRRAKKTRFGRRIRALKGAGWAAAQHIQLLQNHNLKMDQIRFLSVALLNVGNHTNYKNNEVKLIFHAWEQSYYQHTIVADLIVNPVFTSLGEVELKSDHFHNS